MVGNRTLSDLLVERTRRHPERPALVVEDRAGEVTGYSYDELLDAVRRAAAGLSELGIGPGDAVVLQLRNSAEFVFAWLGLAWLGAVSVPSNVANAAAELTYLAEFSEAVGYITEPDYAGTFDEILPGLPRMRHRILARTADAGGGVLFDDLLKHPPLPPDSSAPGAEQVLEMIFTSGTTARPKAVMLTHANLLWAGERVVRGAALAEGDRLITALPMFHINAQEITELAALTVGGTAVLVEEYRASKFWSQLRRHRANAVSLVAMQVRTLLAQPETNGDAEHELRRVIYAINVSDSEKEEFERRFGVELCNGYGLSEGGTVVTFAPPFGDKRWPSIGLPNGDRQVRIVDELGQDLPPGGVGEIIVSGVPGRTLMKGYFKDPAATAAAMRDGWLYTGDFGYLDEKGYAYFVDRKKDLIKRAGENVSASEVEFALSEHPSIAEAAVVGAPDPIRDEEVVAFVVAVQGAELTVEEIQEHCRSRIASFKVPTTVHIVPELPKTSIGKIEKKVLRQRVASV
ncbi:AMP-binding protein [Pseudonocardia acaciae]|uniref:AMP-binding protein n=1 Tax=Pseudonocardia acaciae TaxID=551276 RepID=UPI00068528EF|nr:AMP-binding protein [Pseudonocardia acaciae]